MRTLIVLLGALCILPLADFVENCIECFEKNSDDCDGPAVACNNATDCYILSEMYHVEGDVYHTVKKGCNENGLYPCEQTIYADNYVNAGLEAHIDCCDQDSCNIFGYNMPPDTKPPIGGYCPACFEDNMEPCTTIWTIRCKEIDDKCYEYIGRIRDPAGRERDVHFKGGLSQVGCKLGFQSMVGVDELEHVLFECTEPTFPKHGYY